MDAKKREFLGAAAIVAAAAIPAVLEATRTDAAESVPNSSRHSSLEQKVEQLTAMLQHTLDVHAIQNIVSKMSYLYEAGLYEERLKYLATKTPGVTVEIGARGVFEGLEGARKVMVDVEKSFEKSHAAGMRKTFPNVQFGSDHAGLFETELVGTAVIEIAADGKTAKGVWISLMASGKTHEGDPKPQAQWIWWRSAIDFVKEDGEWKIWHYLKNPYWATPYLEDWVEHSLYLPPVPAPGTMKGAAGHGSPDRPTTKLYDSYRITREPRLEPSPPEPYQTFDPKDSYSW
jgi:SnoaL-like domain